FGAKGGFIVKPRPRHQPDPRDGVEAYRTLINAMLDLTDNVTADGPLHPARVRVLDDDGPYLVVAADKGTASFSDLANQIALERGFWLGDAFASGGEHGYDHKQMAITARGNPPAGICARWAAIPTVARRSRRSASATCRATCSATACCARAI